MIIRFIDKMEKPDIESSFNDIEELEDDSRINECDIINRIQTEKLLNIETNRKTSIQSILEKYLPITRKSFIKKKIEEMIKEDSTHVHLLSDEIYDKEEDKNLYHKDRLIEEKLSNLPLDSINRKKFPYIKEDDWNKSLCELIKRYIPESYRLYYHYRYYTKEVEYIDKHHRHYKKNCVYEIVLYRGNPFINDPWCFSICSYIIDNLLSSSSSSSSY